MDRCGSGRSVVRTRKQNDFCFLFHRFFFHSLSITVERDSALMQDQLFFYLYFDLRHFDGHERKKFFFSFRRFDTT